MRIVTNAENVVLRDHEVVNMGRVIVTLRVLPENMDVFEDLGNRLKELSPDKVEKEPLAFGFYAYVLTKVIPEREGEIEKLENSVKGIRGVKSVEVIGVDRAL